MRGPRHAHEGPGADLAREDEARHERPAAGRLHQELGAVETGHQHVGDDGIGRELVEQVEGPHRVVHEVAFPVLAMRPQHAFEGPQDRHFVVHEEEAAHDQAGPGAAAGSEKETVVPSSFRRSAQPSTTTSTIEALPFRGASRPCATTCAKVSISTGLRIRGTDLTAAEPRGHSPNRRQDGEDEPATGRVCRQSKLRAPAVYRSDGALVRCAPASWPRHRHRPRHHARRGAHPKDPLPRPDGPLTGRSAKSC
jgi:hypothetical protein